MNLSDEQVQGLAPDAASVKAGRKLAAVRHWQNLGHSDVAVWGECKGSKLYQTKVDRSDMTASCSCPSRKFPCKHALGLLFLTAGSPADVPAGETPEWVSEWLERRGARAEKAAQRKADTAAKAADPVQQQKRAEKRHRNILAGIGQLEAWMQDAVRQGLARLELEGAEPWMQQARRLVDAQAPGLASRVRRLGEEVGSGPGWNARLLEGMGSLALLTRAYRGLDRMEEDMAHEVRQLVGITVPQEEVLRGGERVRDRWLVLGQALDDEGHLRVQRTWLWGTGGGRYALVLQFSSGGAPFAETFAPGTAFDAELCYWPGRAPLRALVASREGSTDPLGSPTGGESIAELLERAADVWSRVPWVDQVPALLAGVRPVSLEQGARVLLCDPDGRGLPLSRGDHRALFAISGGHPLHVAVEWDGAQLHALGLFADGAYCALGSRGGDVDAAA